MSERAFTAVTHVFPCFLQCVQSNLLLNYFLCTKIRHYLESIDKETICSMFQYFLVTY